MAKILIIALNRHRLPYPAAPIGAAMVVNALKKSHHDARLLDLGTALHVSTALRRTIRSFKPDVVGFSMRNLDSCVMTTPTTFLPYVRSVVDTVRGATTAPLMIGGAAFSLAPLEILDALELDWGIVGEGEIACVQLAEALVAGTSPAHISGVAGRQTGVTPRTTITDLDSLPGQDHSQIALKTYTRWGGFAGIQTRRGCNLTCSYCVYPHLEGRQMRLRSAESVVSEIAAIRDSGCRHFYFVDSAFNHPRDHAFAICEQLASADLDITWQAYVNPRGLDRGLARVMKASGCIGAELGLDTACETMIDSLGKNFDLAEIATASSALKAADIPFAAHLLFGAPKESWQTITDTVDFLDRHVDANAVFPSIGIRIYRNAPIWNHLVGEGLVDPTDSLISPNYYCSPELGTTPMQRLDEMSITRPTWSTPTDWDKPLLSLVMRILGLLQQRPIWKDVRGYGSRKPMIYGRKTA